MSGFAQTYLGAINPATIQSAVQGATLPEMVSVLGSLQLAAPEIDRQLLDGLSAVNAYLLAAVYSDPDKALSVAQEALTAIHERFSGTWGDVGKKLAPHLMSLTTETAIDRLRKAIAPPLKAIAQPLLKAVPKLTTHQTVTGDSTANVRFGPIIPSTDYVIEITQEIIDHYELPETLLGFHLFQDGFWRINVPTSKGGYVINERGEMFGVQGDAIIPLDFSGLSARNKKVMTTKAAEIFLADMEKAFSEAEDQIEDSRVPIRPQGAINLGRMWESGRYLD